MHDERACVQIGQRQRPHEAALWSASRRGGSVILSILPSPRLARSLLSPPSHPRHHLIFKPPPQVPPLTMPGLDTHTVRPSSPCPPARPCERLPNSEQQWTHLCPRSSRTCRSAATSSPSRSSSSSPSSSGPSPRTSSTPVSPRRLARLARLIPPPPSWRRPSSSRRGVLGFVRRSADSLPAPSQQTTTTTTTRATRSGASPPLLVSSILLAGLLAVGQVHLVQEHS